LRLGVVAEALAFFREQEPVSAGDEVRVSEAGILHIFARRKELANGLLHSFAIERDEEGEVECTADEFAHVEGVALLGFECHECEDWVAGNNQTSTLVSTPSFRSSKTNAQFGSMDARSSTRTRWKILYMPKHLPSIAAAVAFLLISLFARPAEAQSAFVRVNQAGHTRVLPSARI
jgi:hypothetical protein